MEQEFEVQSLQTHKYKSLSSVCSRQDCQPFSSPTFVITNVRL